MILNSDAIAPLLANTRGVPYGEADLTPQLVEWALGKTKELKGYPKQGGSDPDQCTIFDTNGVYGVKQRPSKDIKKERVALKADLQAVLGTSFMMMDMSVALQYAPGVSRGKEAMAKKTQKVVAKVSSMFGKKGVEETEKKAEVVDEDLAKAREGFVGHVVTTCKRRKEDGERPYDKKKAHAPPPAASHPLTFRSLYHLATDDKPPTYAAPNKARHSLLPIDRHCWNPRLIPRRESARSLSPPPSHVGDHRDARGDVLKGEERGAPDHRPHEPPRLRPPVRQDRQDHLRPPHVRRAAHAPASGTFLREQPLSPELPLPLLRPLPLCRTAHAM